MEYKHIKPEYLEMVTGGDKGLIKELVVMFREQTIEIFREMQSLLTGKEYNSLGLLAHKAKSSVAIMGMESLAEMLKNFELQAKDAREVEMYRGYITRFGEETKFAVIELENMVNGEQKKCGMINIERNGKIDVITFSANKLNANTIEEMKEGVSTLFVNPHSRVIIDLSGVEYIDSSGFAFFLSLHKAAKNNYGILKFVHPEPRVSDLFNTLHLHTVFEIYDNMNDCVNSFK